MDINFLRRTRNNMGFGLKTISTSMARAKQVVRKNPVSTPFCHIWQLIRRTHEQAMVKIGQSDSTVDPVFDQLEAQFKEQYKNIKNLGKYVQNYQTAAKGKSLPPSHHCTVKCDISLLQSWVPHRREWHKWLPINMTPVTPCTILPRNWMRTSLARWKPLVCAWYVVLDPGHCSLLERSS